MGPLPCLLYCLMTVLHQGPHPGAGSSSGDRLIAAFQENSVKAIEEKEPGTWRGDPDLTLLQKQWRTELREMLGIPDSLAKTELKTERTGIIDCGFFTVEKIVFQSRPGLYVTANLYIPKNLRGKAPAVLYVCGHSNTFEEIEVGGKKTRRSLGSKVSYRHHGAMLAEKGYVCLILDTLQLGEIEGLHHGTYTKEMYWWQSYGYTPGGVECWNAIRAIDLLQSLPQVDPARIGVTGRSGGGATTWWVTAVDERVKCGVGVAGLADLRAHLIAGEKPRFNQGVITGHCDCMFMVNLFRWDFSRLGMLCAPRPMLLLNTDDDGIFPVEGFRRPASRMADFYQRMGVPDRFSVYMGKGDHVDTPELQAAAFAWLEKWLRPGLPSQIIGPRREMPDWPLRVLNSIPKDEINSSCHDWFIEKRTQPDIRYGTVSPLWWNPKAEVIRKQLNQSIPPTTLGKISSTEKPKWVLFETRESHSSWSLVQEGQTISLLWAGPGQNPESIKRIYLAGSGEDAFRVIKESGPVPTGALFLPGKGPMSWSDKRTIDQGPFQVARRLALLGTTIGGLQARALIETVQAIHAGSGSQSLEVIAKGDQAVVAAVASSQTKAIAILNLDDYPTDWKDAPAFLGLATRCEPHWLPLLSQAQSIQVPQKIKEELVKVFGFQMIPPQLIGKTRKP